MLQLKNATTHREEIKKSVFIAHAARADSAPAAHAFIADVSRADANHNCWAYRIGTQYRFVDDGEPAGTAGRPICAAIQGRGLNHVAVVVVRYFGGIKLVWCPASFCHFRANLRCQNKARAAGNIESIAKLRNAVMAA